MKYFDQFITRKALDYKFDLEGGLSGPGSNALMDAVIDEAVKTKNPMVKNIQVALSKTLFDQVEDVTNTLGISKRKFLELSIILGLDRANELILELDVFEFVPEDQKPSNEPTLRAVK